MTGAISPLSPPLDLVSEETTLTADSNATYAIDGLVPRLVFRPGDKAEVSKILTWANSEGLCVTPWGAGTQMALGNPPRQLDLVLDMSRLDRVIDFQPADLTVTVEAGIKLEGLQRRLASAGKFLPLEAPLASSGTIGGVLSTGLGGPLRHTFGLPRDWIIGMEVASPSGLETKAGGRVVKNVTGYDLCKLYTGSLGTLAVITEATFKLAPLPAARAALVAMFPTLEQAISAGHELLRQVFTPQATHVLNQIAAEAVLGPSLPVSGCALLAFFAGRSVSLERQLSEGEGLLRGMGATAIEPKRENSFSLIQDLADLGWNDHLPAQVSLRINLPPAADKPIVEHLEGIPVFLGDSSTIGLTADLGFGGLRLLQATPPLWSADDIRGLRQVVVDMGGSLIIEKAPVDLKDQIDVWGDEPSAWEIIKRLKQNFDPHGVLNPGRFIGGL